MGELNAIPMRINKVEGVAGQVKLSGGPGTVEAWGAPAPAAHVHGTGDVTSGQFPLARMPRAATGNFLEGNGVAADPIYNALVAGNIPNLDVAKITSGAFAVNRGGTGLAAIAQGGILYAAVANVLSRIAPGAANQVLRSTAANALQFAALLVGDIPNLTAAKTTSGQFPLARMPRAATGSFLEGDGVGADPIFNALVAGDIPNLATAKITSGQFPLDRMPRAASGVLTGKGVGVNPAYEAVTGGPDYLHQIICPRAYFSIGQGTWSFNTHDDLGLYLKNETKNDGDNISYRIFLPAGTYQIGCTVIRFSEQGIVDCDLDGVEKGSKDCYHADPSMIYWEIAGIVVGTSGYHTLRFRLDGKNGAASAYALLLGNIIVGRSA